LADPPGMKKLASMMIAAQPIAPVAGHVIRGNAMSAPDLQGGAAPRSCRTRARQAQPPERHDGPCIARTSYTGPPTSAPFEATSDQRSFFQEQPQHGYRFVGIRDDQRISIISPNPPSKKTSAVSPYWTPITLWSVENTYWRQKAPHHRDGPRARPARRAGQQRLPCSEIFNVPARVNHFKMD